MQKQPIESYLQHISKIEKILILNKESSFV